MNERKLISTYAYVDYMDFLGAKHSKMFRDAYYNWGATEDTTEEDAKEYWLGKIQNNNLDEDFISWAQVNNR